MFHRCAEICSSDVGTLTFSLMSTTRLSFSNLVLLNFIGLTYKARRGALRTCLIDTYRHRFQGFFGFPNILRNCSCARFVKHSPHIIILLPLVSLDDSNSTVSSQKVKISHCTPQISSQLEHLFMLDKGVCYPPPHTIS